MAGTPIAKVPAVKGGAQPVGYDAIAQADQLMREMGLKGLSARGDVPDVTDATGQTYTPAASVTSLRMPARVDPQLITDAAQELARAEALRGAASFVPATVFGVKHGRAAGPMPGGGGPIWDAVRSQITAPVQRAQLEASQLDSANDVLNKVALLNQGASAQDRSTALSLAGSRGAAQVAAADRAEQQRQFGASQATARRGQDLQLEAAKFRLQGPQAEKLHQARALLQATRDGLDDLEQKVRSGSASPMSGTILGRRVGTDAGNDTANTIGMLANNLSQVGEKRGLRGPMQDEIAHELNSGLSTPQAGLKIIAKWRKYAADYESELDQGRLAPAAAPPPSSSSTFDPDSFLNGGQ